MVITFITVLAWIGAVGGTALVGLFVYTEHKYNFGGKDGGPSLEKLLHEVQGLKVTYPTKKYALVALISWAWVISTFIT